MSTFPSYLTQEQIDHFHRNGFIVISEFWDAATVQGLRASIEREIDGFDPASSKTIFSTAEQDRHRRSNEYFLNSGGKIRFFWEEKAWTDGELTMEPKVAINKIGHNLHDLNKEFREASYDVRIGRICRELGMSVPKSVQSMFIFKQALVGGEVCPHQDGSFLYTEPQTCIGFWWALDQCRKDNGCLWVKPGSHKLGVQRRFRRKGGVDDGTEFRKVADNSVTSGSEEWDISGSVPVEIPAGSLVVLHDAAVHYSEGNTSPLPRWAYSIHVVDGKEGVVYPKDNWLQREEAEGDFGVIPAV